MLQKFVVRGAGFWAVNLLRLLGRLAGRATKVNVGETIN